MLRSCSVVDTGIFTSPHLCKGVGRGRTWTLCLWPVAGANGILLSLACAPSAALFWPPVSKSERVVWYPSGTMAAHARLHHPSLEERTAISSHCEGVLSSILCMAGPLGDSRGHHHAISFSHAHPCSWARCANSPTHFSGLGECSAVLCCVVLCCVMLCCAVLCCVVWCCVVVRCGVVWCGVVWCGVPWCGVPWCGVVWCGVVWCGVVWCGVVWCGVVWCGVVWCGVVWCGVVWCGVVLCGVVCRGRCY